MATSNSAMANPKSDVRLTVHRATHQIGGNCIELDAADGHRIILDVGRPLDAPQDACHLLPKTLDLAGAVDGVLISHPQPGPLWTPGRRAGGMADLLRRRH